MKAKKSTEKKVTVRKRRVVPKTEKPTPADPVFPATSTLAPAAPPSRVAEVGDDRVKNYVTVDYPQDGEIVTSGCYSIRISTSATERVDVSIDGKEWEPCRESVGFWWYDWAGYGAGAHTVVSRIPVGKRALKSKARSFTVLV